MFNGSWGVLAQGFSLASTFLPVILNRSDALILLVAFTAIATIVTPGMSLAAQVRLPSIRTEFGTSVQTYASLITCGLGGILVLVCAWGIGIALGSNQSAIAALVLAALCVAQVLFSIGFALLVRRSSYRDMMLTRLAYAFATLVLTVWVTFAQGDGLGYCLAATGGYLTGFVVALLMLRKTPVGSRTRRLTLRTLSLQCLGAMRRSVALSVSLTIGAAAGQIGALVTPALGPLAGPWALAIRVMGGFQTLGGVVIGSNVDSRISTAARARDSYALHRSVRSAWIAGAMTGLASVFAVAGTAFFTSTMIPGTLIAFFSAAAVGFIGTNVVLAPVGRILGLVGRPSRRLLWDCVRCAMFAPALLVPKPELVMSVLTAAGIISLVSYFFLVRGAINTSNND
ncbi:hypothetical protein [Microbacterium natoriense]